MHYTVDSAAGNSKSVLRAGMEEVQYIAYRSIRQTEVVAKAVCIV